MYVRCHTLCRAFTGCILWLSLALPLATCLVLWGAVVRKNAPPPRTRAICQRSAAGSFYLTTNTEMKHQPLAHRVPHAKLRIPAHVLHATVYSSRLRPLSYKSSEQHIIPLHHPRIVPHFRLDHMTFDLSTALSSVSGWGASAASTLKSSLADHPVHWTLSAVATTTLGLLACTDYGRMRINQRLPSGWTRDATIMRTLVLRTRSYCHSLESIRCIVD